MKKRLQVFVSSTFVDLIEERQAAVSAILKSGHIPAGMELFTAGDQSQWNIIKRWIDESDVYMLILGARYGSIETTSGLSYTELEYNYAISTGKPLFAVVITEDAIDQKVALKGRTVLEDKNPNKLKEFKKKVLSNMSSFFSDLKDIRLVVMESLPEIAATRDLSGWISGSEVPDTKGLVDEITKLNNEVTKLRNENLSLNQKLTLSKSTDESEFAEIFKILSLKKIDIPTEVTGHAESINKSILEVFLAIKNFVLKGITNQIDQKERVYFYYHNICPELQIYDLVVNEKVAGVRYRRFAITKKGQAFLAYLEKKNYLNKV